MGIVLFIHRWACIWLVNWQQCVFTLRSENVNPASISTDNGIHLRLPMKGSIFIRRVPRLCPSLSVGSALLQDNEAPGRAMHFGALNCPDGDTQTTQYFRTMDRAPASLPVCADSSKSRLTLIYYFKL